MILRGHSSFAYGIFSSFIFLGGRPFDNKQDAFGKKDWSEMVWDLLEFGLKKAFNRKRSGIRTQPRFKGDVAAFDGMSIFYNKPHFGVSIAEEILGKYRIKTLVGKAEIPPGSISDFGDPDNYDSGVSVVIIEAVMLE